MSITAERRLQNQFNGRQYPRKDWNCDNYTSCQSYLEREYKDLQAGIIDKDINEILYDRMIQYEPNDVLLDKLNPMKILYIEQPNENKETPNEGPMPVAGSLLPVIDQQSNEMVELVRMTKANDRTMGQHLQRAETFQDLDLINRLPKEERELAYKKLLDSNFKGHRNPDNMVELVQDSIRSKTELDNLLNLKVSHKLFSKIK